MPSKKAIIFPAVSVLICIIAGIFYFQHAAKYPSTDDAYIQAHIINIAPEINGRVIAIDVSNQQNVKKGELIFEIDPQPFQIALNKAKAEMDSTLQEISAANSTIKSARALVEQRQAELIEIKADTKRTFSMVKKHFFSVEQQDMAIKNLSVAKASLHAAISDLNKAEENLGKQGKANAQYQIAKANLAQAELNLSYTKITAPTDGIIANFNLRVGSEVTAYQPEFALIDTSQWWSLANYKETNLSQIKLGDKAKIKIDMYPNKIFHGLVTEIYRDSGASFSLLPPENASGNWVKVTQRFPVKIKILHPDPHYPLRLGASNTVIIDTTLPPRPRETK